MSNFAANLRAARDALSITQEEAARRAGITQGNWARYEAGDVVPSIDMAGIR